MLSKLPFEFPGYLTRLAAGLPPLPMAVVGAGHPLVMDSARRAMEAGFIAPVLIGDADEIAAAAGEAGWDIAGIRVVASAGEAEAAQIAAALARNGEVAALMKGHVHTDTLMRAILTRSAGLRTDRRVSHVFHMTIPGRDRVMHITDAAVNVHPGVAEKLDILSNAVELAQKLGMTEPKVALLSGAETVNPSMPSSVEADEVVRRANNGGVKGAIVDGPFGFDNAVSPEAARIKGVDSPVAGQADILVVPNLEAGNFLFKQMVYFMSATAAGIVMGAKVPVVLTSRADPPEARLAAAAIASIIGRQ
ncbi:MAG: bifunctional enoyl-CoA hydratase/phosphate acetyltransferase [Alphaproteobacteria bacterium]|nr:bifunctional enoyl-CoA hydratase/phosphate acetyltransferase [Alphaproteobacteria bacterium]